MLLYRWLQAVAKTKGGAKALIYRDTYLSWRGLRHRVDRRATEFRSAGVRPGDWVGLMLGNVPDFVILSLALNKLDAAALPLDPTTSTKELEAIMDAAPLRGLITRPRGGDAPLPSAGRRKKGGRGAPVSRRRLQGTLLSCSIYGVDPQPLADDEDAQICAVLVTADSSGEPKLVERTAGNLTAEADNASRALQVGGEDRVLLTVPLFQSFGFDTGLLLALRCGATMYLEDEVAAPRILKLVREQQITLLPGTPNLFEEMAKIPAARPLAHEPLRFVAAGSDGVTPATAEAFHKHFGVRPMSCYHTTETGTVSVDRSGKHGDSMGKLLEGVEARIINSRTGKQAGVSRKGQLWVRSAAVSPLVLSGNNHAGDGAPTVVGSLDANGWYRTGYLATLDRAKRLHLQGREDDVVVLEGKRVALGEVAGCIEAFPAVKLAEARLITDPLGGPMVVARVVVKDEKETEEQEIIDFCAKNLSPYKVPRRIEFCKAL